MEISRRTGGNGETGFHGEKSGNPSLDRGITLDDIRVKVSAASSVAHAVLHLFEPSPLPDLRYRRFWSYSRLHT
jgi:hypothetical protein